MLVPPQNIDACRCVAVPTQSPGALDMGITVTDVKVATNLDHVEIEGVEPVNSMSSDAVEIKGEHNHRPIREMASNVKPKNIVRSCWWCEWMALKQWGMLYGSMG